MPDGFIELPDWLRPAPPRVEERPAKPDASRNPAPLPPPPPTGAPAPLALLLPDGRRIPITARTLLGRDPEPRAGEPPAILITTGADRSVSKTHALVEPSSPDTLLLTDRGSTNGTTLVAPDGAIRRCVPEAPVPVRRGERFRLGDLELVVD